MSSIRAFRAEEDFAVQLMRSVNSNSIAIISQSLCGGWLAIRLDFLGALISAFGKSLSRPP